MKYILQFNLISIIIILIIGCRRDEKSSTSYENSKLSYHDQIFKPHLLNEGEILRIQPKSWNEKYLYIINIDDDSLLILRSNQPSPSLADSPWLNGDLEFLCELDSQSLKRSQVMYTETTEASYYDLNGDGIPELKAGANGDYSELADIQWRGINYKQFKSKIKKARKSELKIEPRANQ